MNGPTTHAYRLGVGDLSALPSYDRQVFPMPRSERLVAPTELCSKAVGNARRFWSELGLLLDRRGACAVDSARWDRSGQGFPPPLIHQRWRSTLWPRTLSLVLFDDSQVLSFAGWTAGAIFWHMRADRLASVPRCGGRSPVTLHGNQRCRFPSPC